MSKRDRIRRERAAGRRKPIADRRNKLTSVEEWRRENRRANREMVEKGLDGFVRPELGSTADMFEPAPTDEPGTMYACEDCGWAGYVEGIVATNSNPQGIQDAESAILGACPQCGGTMYATDTIILNGPEGGIAATHPAGLRAALEILLGQVESGEVTPDEAIEQLRKEPMIRRVIDGLEKYPVTTALVTAIIFFVLSYVAPPAQDQPSAPAPALTPEQVEQIIETVISELDNEPETSPQNEPEEPRLPSGR